MVEKSFALCKLDRLMLTTLRCWANYSHFIPRGTFSTRFIVLLPSLKGVGNQSELGVWTMENDVGVVVNTKGGTRLTFWHIGWGSRQDVVSWGSNYGIAYLLHDPM